MSIVVNLGKCSLSNFLNDWLELVEICTFDTSLCNVELRNLFQDHFVVKTFTDLNQSNIKSTHSFLEWSFKHHCDVESLTLTNNFLNQRQSTFFQRCNQTVKRFHELWLSKIPCFVSDPTGSSALVSLTMMNCKSRNIEALSKILHQTSNLTHICLSNSKYIDDKLCISVIRRNSYLTSCDFSHTRITDRTVCKLSKYYFGFHKLNVEGCSLLTNRSIHHLTEFCYEMTHLNIRDCKLITFDCLLESCRYFTNMIELTHTTCDVFSNEFKNEYNSTIQCRLSKSKDCGLLTTKFR
jgi:hypothetical protein